MLKTTGKESLELQGVYANGLQSARPTGPESIQGGEAGPKPHRFRVGTCEEMGDAVRTGHLGAANTCHRRCLGNAEGMPHPAPKSRQHLLQTWGDVGSCRETEGLKCAEVRVSFLSFLGPFLTNGVQPVVVLVAYHRVSRTSRVHVPPRFSESLGLGSNQLDLLSGELVGHVIDGTATAMREYPNHCNFYSSFRKFEERVPEMSFSVLSLQETTFLERLNEGAAVRNPDDRSVIVLNVGDLPETALTTTTFSGVRAAPFRCALRGTENNLVIVVYEDGSPRTPSAVRKAFPRDDRAVGAQCAVDWAHILDGLGDPPIILRATLRKSGSYHSEPQPKKDHTVSTRGLEGSWCS